MIADFSTRLINISEVYAVDEEGNVFIKDTNEPLTITVAKTSRPIVLFKEGMKIPPEAMILNPYKETVGICRPREWFFDNIEQAIGAMAKMLIHTLVSDVVNKRSDCNGAALVHSIASKITEKTYTEIDGLPINAFIQVFYNKKTKTATAHSDIKDETFKKDYKVLASTYTVIRELFDAIFGRDFDYEYEAKIMPIAETDAKLHVYIALLTAMDPYLEGICDRNIESNVLNEHLDRLEDYSKAYKYVSSTVTTAVDAQDTPSPWNAPVTNEKGEVIYNPAAVAAAGGGPGGLMPPFQNPAVNTMGTMPYGGSPYQTQLTPYGAQPQMNNMAPWQPNGNAQYNPYGNNAQFPQVNNGVSYSYGQAPIPGYGQAPVYGQQPQYVQGGQAYNPYAYQQAPVQQQNNAYLNGRAPKSGNGPMGSGVAAR